jgi:hypothetical protein
VSGGMIYGVVQLYIMLQLMDLAGMEILNIQIMY